MAALLSSPEYEDMTPAELKAHLTGVLAQRDVVKNIPKWAGGEDKNRLLFLGEIQDEKVMLQVSKNGDAKQDKEFW